MAARRSRKASNRSKPRPKTSARKPKKRATKKAKPRSSPAVSVDGVSAADRRRWQAQSDAETLASASEVVADAGRLKRAQAEVNRKANAVQRAARKLS